MSSGSTGDSSVGNNKNIATGSRSSRIESDGEEWKEYSNREITLNVGNTGSAAIVDGGGRLTVAELTRRIASPSIGATLIVKSERVCIAGGNRDYTRARRQSASR